MGKNKETVYDHYKKQKDKCLKNADMNDKLTNIYVLISIVLNAIPGIFALIDPQYAKISNLISIVLGCVSAYILYKKPWNLIRSNKNTHYLLDELLMHFDNKKGVFFKIKNKDDREQLLTKEAKKILDNFNNLDCQYITDTANRINGVNETNQNNPNECS